MVSIRKAKRRALRWDRYRFKIGENYAHPPGCCRAHTSWARAEIRRNGGNLARPR